MLKFEEGKHEYSLPTGEILKSVTQYIDEAGLGADKSRFTDFHRDRGRAVHMVCEFDDLGCLEESSIDPRIIPYVEAYRKFKAEQQFAWEGVEDRRWHMVYRYAGTIDRWGLMVLGGKEKPTVLDLKSGVPERSWGLQLSAYAHLLDETVQWERVVLRLTKEGKYFLTVFPQTEAAEDWSTFVSAVNIVNWKSKRRAA